MATPDFDEVERLLESERARSRAPYERARRIGQFIAVPLLAVLFGVGAWSAFDLSVPLSRQGRVTFAGVLGLGVLATSLIYKLLPSARYSGLIAAIIGATLIGFSLAWVARSFGGG